MSDVEIVISVAEDISPAGDDDPKAQYSTLTPLQQIPGHNHSQILSPSPYIVAQASAMALMLLGEMSATTTCHAIDLTLVPGVLRPSEVCIEHHLL